MSDDPWKSIDAKVLTGALNARRVDANIPWNLFWAIDHEHRCALVLRHHAPPPPSNQQPKVRGLEIVTTKPDEHGETTQILRLLDTSQRDVFHQLCLDVVAATSKATSEAQASFNFLARTWRWHHLLKGGRNTRLSSEEQKGLMGELFVLEHYLLELLPAHDAMAAWTGPLGAPKDFEVARIYIEAKARRGAATPFVSISSEHQLSTTDNQTLFLHVLELDLALEGTDPKVTLTEVAARIKLALQNTDPGAVDRFESLLTASGFNFDEDYSDCPWIVGPGHFFEVRDSFPRITPAAYPGGVTNVRYSISLKECAPFYITTDAMWLKLKGNSL